MKAQVGDWLVIQPRYVDAHGRRGLILDVPDDAGGPPYLVRWTDTDREALVFPGPDARVEEKAGRA